MAGIDALRRASALGLAVGVGAVAGCGGGTTTVIQQAPPTTVAAPATTTAQATAFRGIVSCGVGTNRSDRTCSGGDAPGAGFQAFGASNVVYEMCAIPPTKGLNQCAQATTGADGERSYLPIDANEVGQWHVEWRVQGRLVAQRTFTLAVEGGE